jgi:hypothetical protein
MVWLRDELRPTGSISLSAIYDLTSVALFSLASLASAARAIAVFETYPALALQYRCIFGRRLGVTMVGLLGSISFACVGCAVLIPPRFDCSIMIWFWIVFLSVVIPLDAASYVKGRVSVLLLAATLPIAFVPLHPVYVWMRDRRAFLASLVAVFNVALVIGYGFWGARTHFGLW